MHMRYCRLVADGRTSQGFTFEYSRQQVLPFGYLPGVVQEIHQAVDDLPVIGGFDVKFHRSAAEGSSVLNERSDALIIGPVRMQFWVCGVFEVHNGRITLWRDYFDMYNFLKGIARGLAGAVVPSLRPRF